MLFTSQKIYQYNLDNLKNPFQIYDSPSEVERKIPNISLPALKRAFKNNTIFKYRVAATNGMGMGAYSEELHITTDTVPEEV